MQRSTKIGLQVVGLLAFGGGVTACGDLETPMSVVAKQPKVPAQMDDAAMKRLMRDVKSGFGEEHPDMSTMSFDRPS